jgi:hypothetical protein
MVLRKYIAVNKPNVCPSNYQNVHMPQVAANTTTKGGGQGEVYLIKLQFEPFNMLNCAEAALETVIRG